TADLEQLWCRKKHHLRREMKNRVHERSLLDHLIVEPPLLGGNRGREPRGTGADDQHITNRHLFILADPHERVASQPTVNSPIASADSRKLRACSTSKPRARPAPSSDLRLFRKQADGGEAVLPLHARRRHPPNRTRAPTVA